MASYQQYSHLDLLGNEIQNANFQNLAQAPANPTAGRFYFNTADGTLYVYNGESWVDALNQGKIYTFQNGLVELTGDDAGKVQIEIATGASAGNVSLTADSHGLAASVAEASTSAKGIIEIATDSEFSTGTAETLAVNPKQVQDAIADFITLEDLSVNSDGSNVSSILEYNSTTGELSLDVRKLREGVITISANSTDYLTYDASEGYLGAKVDTTVEANSTQLITSGAVQTAIDNALTSAVKYMGTWDATGQTDYSSIALPVKKGYLYYVSGGSDVTIGGITWNAGDYLLVDANVAAGGTLTDVSKIDNTEASDIVRLDAVQTLTNKTINAASNTISNLATGNFASGVISTVVAGTATASATVIPSELAVANALAGATEGMVTVDGAQELTNKTISADDNTITELELDNFKSGVVTTVVAGTATASDTVIASELAIAKGLAVKVEKFSVQNTALTETSGVCTWTITNSIGSADVQVAIYRVTDGVLVGAYVEVGASTITVKFNATADIAADTFRAVVIGL